MTSLEKPALPGIANSTLTLTAAADSPKSYFPDRPRFAMLSRTHSKKSAATCIDHPALPEWR